MERQVSAVCKSAFFHIRNISRIRKFLSVSSTKALVHAFVTCRLDNCNSLLYGLPKHLIAISPELCGTADLMCLFFLHRRPRTHDVPPLCKLQAGLKLLNISLAASFLVVLAGDVSLNPGPETDPCALCSKG